MYTNQQGYTLSKNLKKKNYRHFFVKCRSAAGKKYYKFIDIVKEHYDAGNIRMYHKYPNWIDVDCIPKIIQINLHQVISATSNTHIQDKYS